jgi:hypothetical protein
VPIYPVRLLMKSQKKFMQKSLSRCKLNLSWWHASQLLHDSHNREGYVGRFGNGHAIAVIRIKGRLRTVNFSQRARRYRRRSNMIRFLGISFFGSVTVINKTTKRMMSVQYHISVCEILTAKWPKCYPIKFWILQKIRARKEAGTTPRLCFELCPGLCLRGSSYKRNH